jgi:4,5-DOPA dioxygenase extradiol
MELSDLQRMADAAKPSEKMPVLFLGHGSPLYAIQENAFTAEWQRLGRELPRPRAVLCVSAHWLTQGTAVTAVEKPATIHDFGGFPPELFAVQYPAPGDPAAAREVAAALGENGGPPVGLDLEWGLDHGTWSVLRHVYPGADIPVLQLSIDYPKPGAWHYDLGRRLAGLRRKGFLIVGSGNMVHNLRRIDFSNAEGGYDWAETMNATFKKHILDGDHAPLLDYAKLGPEAELAIPTPDHYYPLLYVLGLQEKGEAVSVFNDKAVMGSITMTSLKIG